MNPQKIMTICFLLKEVDGSTYICLAEKKRGFRVGKANGYGGKQEEGETLEECAIRETIEESGIKPKSVTKFAEVYFYDWDRTYICHVYASHDWEGEPVETEEMCPAWYLIDEIPFEKMGQADPMWLPCVLDGQRVVANFKFDKDENMYFKEVRVLALDEGF